MQSKDIYGKTLSNEFQSAIKQVAQYVKPRVIVDLIDMSKSLFTSSIVYPTTDSTQLYKSSDYNMSNTGYYFNYQMALNGKDYESFNWARADDLGPQGYPLVADGTCNALPNDLSDEFTYSYESMYTSDSSGNFNYTQAIDPDLQSYYPSFSLYQAVSNSPITPIYINMDGITNYGLVNGVYQIGIQSVKKINKLRVTTSKYKGAIKSFIFQHYVKINTVVNGVTQTRFVNVIEKTYTFDNTTSEFEKVITIPDYYFDYSSDRTSQIFIRIIPISTQFPNDHARIVSINARWEVDISDYVIDVQSNRVRDLHETSLPIAGTSQSSLTLVLDNTGKEFGQFSNAAIYGALLDKNTKFYISNGWKKNTSAPDLVLTTLTAAMTNTATTFSVVDSYYLPLGDVSSTNLESNYYIVTIDKALSTEEKILVKSTSGNTLTVQQRGYAGTNAAAHALGASVEYDPFEYVPLGTWYMEDLATSAAGMQVTINLQNKFKFFNDEVLSNGFFRSDTTIPDGISELLLTGNFPRKDIYTYNRYSDFPAKNGAIAQFKFNEKSNDIYGNAYPQAALVHKIKMLNPSAGDDLKSMQIGANSISSMQSIADTRNITSAIAADYTFLDNSLSLGSKDGVNLFKVQDLFKYKVSSAAFGNGNTTITFTIDSPWYGIPPTGNTHNLSNGQYVNFKYNSNTSSSWSMNANVSYKIISVLNNSVTISATSGVGLGQPWNPSGAYPGSSGTLQTTPTLPADSGSFISPSVSTKGSATHTDAWICQHDTLQPWWWKNSAQPFQGTVEGYIASQTAGGGTQQFFPTIGYTSFIGMRLYVNDLKWIDQWSTVSATTTASTPSGVNYATNSILKLKIEYFSPADSGAAFKVYDSYGLTNSYTMVSSAYKDSINTVFNNTSTQNYLHYTGYGNTLTTSYVMPIYSFAFPSSKVQMTAGTALAWDSGNTSAYISNSFATGSVDSFILISPNPDPTNTYINVNGDWSMELLVKAPNGGHGGQGEYISSWSNGSPTAGFEFFYTSLTNHGIRTISNTGANVSAISSTAMPNNGTDWNHIVATYAKSNNVLSYYVNGILHANVTYSAGDFIKWGNTDITIGGRAGYIDRTVNPAVLRGATSTANSNGINMYIDEFSIYKKCLSSDDISKRYIETTIKENKIYPYVYSYNKTVFEALNDISFSDLGRVYIDENDVARYESYYEFWEPQITQHSTIQKSISGDDYIIDVNLTKSIQVNTITVKVAGVSTMTSNTQSIWRAPDNSTLGVLTLASDVNITPTDSDTGLSIKVYGLNVIPFSSSGYIRIDDDIYKYSSANTTHFTGITRPDFVGSFTSYSAHTAGAKVREVRSFVFEYDKRPSYNVQYPFITGIQFEDPNQIDVIKWQTTPFKAQLVLSASKDVASNTVIFIEGTDPLTSKVSYTSIAGIPIETNQAATQLTDQTAVNSTNKRRYGVKEVVIESPLITSESIAKALADFILSKLSDPIPVISVTTALDPTLQVGDRIRLSSVDQLGITNTDYWVTGIQMQTGSGYSQTMELREVS